MGKDRDKTWLEMTVIEREQHRLLETQKQNEADSIEDIHRQEGIVKASKNAVAKAEMRARVQRVALNDKFWITILPSRQEIEVHISTQKDGVKTWHYKGVEECKPWHRAIRHMDCMRGEMNALRAAVLVMETARQGAIDK